MCGVNREQHTARVDSRHRILRRGVLTKASHDTAKRGLHETASRSSRGHTANLLMVEASHTINPRILRQVRMVDQGLGCTVAGNCKTTRQLTIHTIKFKPLGT